MPEPILRKLIDHLRWADTLPGDALHRAGTPPAKALELYGHILGAEHVWVARIHGRPASIAVWPALALDECAKLAKANADALTSLLDDAGDEATAASLQRAVRYRNSAGAEFESSVEDILLHVAMHGQYHRAKVNLLLRNAGLEPAPADSIAFVRGTPAATRQP